MNCSRRTKQYRTRTGQKKTEVFIMLGLTPYYRNNRNLAFNPFRDLDEFEKKLFGDSMNGFFRDSDIAEFKTDITDQGDSFLLEADLPGFSKEDINLDLNGDTLTINAERHSEYEDKDKKGNYIRCERSYGKYSRSFDVSEIDCDNIKAKLDNGVLKLTLPKKQKAVAAERRLEIE